MSKEPDAKKTLKSFSIGMLIEMITSMRRCSNCFYENLGRGDGWTCQGNCRWTAPNYKYWRPAGWIKHWRLFSPDCVSSDKKES